MTSQVGICNLALGHLGDEATVTSIDPPEGSEQAEHCAVFYPMALSSILEDHDWGFATKRATLVQLSEDPPEQWGYIYALPNLCVKPRAVLIPGTTADDDSEEFLIESNSSGTTVIYTNAANAILRYTAYVDDTTKFTGSFTLAFARKLASFLAGPIIKGSEGMKVAADQMKIYEQLELPRAKRSDSNARRIDTYDNFVPSGHKARL